jgi:hypothetical protein
LIAFKKTLERFGVQLRIFSRIFVPGNFRPCLTADIKVEKCLTADIKFKQVPDKPFPVDMSWLCYLIVIQ